MKDPAAGVQFLSSAVASFVCTTQKTFDVAETSEFVTTREVAAAAKLTEPAILLMVCSPVVPPAVFVLSNPRDPLFESLNRSVGEEAPSAVVWKIILPGMSDAPGVPSTSKFITAARRYDAPSAPTACMPSRVSFAWTIVFASSVVADLVLKPHTLTPAALFPREMSDIRLFEFPLVERYTGTVPAEAVTSLS